MKHCHEFLQHILPELGYRWKGFRKVHRQVCRRIHRRMQELGFTSYREYCRYVERHGDEKSTLDSLLDITITRFWRDKGVFALLETIVFPDLIDRAQREKRTTVRCWSAGCCNGEEPYSLQLLWHLRLPPTEIELEIIATDRNETLLNRARTGIFDRGALKDIPGDVIEKGFERKQADYIIKELYKHGIHFLRQDIRHEMPGGPFDIILCRNFILTYFDETVARPVLERLLSRLRSGGYFITGSNENIPPISAGLTRIKRGEPVYKLPDH